MKKSDNKESAANAEFKDLPSINKKSHQYSNYLGNIISNLSNPRFLGSFHMKKETSLNNNSVENLIESDLKLKMTRSLKNTLFNPITKILIISAIVFNIIWLLLIIIF